MGRIDGKVCIVTGGAAGMGAAHVEKLASEGGIVYATDVNESAGTALAKKLGKNVIFVKQDVTKEEDWEALVQKIMKEQGHIDVLVNNAGIMTKTLPIEELELDEYMKGIMIDQVSVFIGMKYVLPVMKEQRSGSIINIASTNSTGGCKGLASYNSAKYAVRGLSKTAVIEAGPYNVRVNSILPGAIDTAMMHPVSNPIMDGIYKGYTKQIPLQRCGAPEEISNAVLFLASDDASYVSGAEILVDGGMTSPNQSYSEWVMNIVGKDLYEIGNGYRLPKNPILRAIVKKLV